MWLSHHNKPNDIKEFDFIVKFKTELCKNWKAKNGLCPGGKKVILISADLFIFISVVLLTGNKNSNKRNT